MPKRVDSSENGDDVKCKRSNSDNKQKNNDQETPPKKLKSVLRSKSKIPPKVVKHHRREIEGQKPEYIIEGMDTETYVALLIMHLDRLTYPERYALGSSPFPFIISFIDPLLPYFEPEKEVFVNNLIQRYPEYVDRVVLKISATLISAIRYFLESDTDKQFIRFDVKSCRITDFVEPLGYYHQSNVHARYQRLVLLNFITMLGSIGGVFKQQFPFKFVRDVLLALQSEAIQAARKESEAIRVA